MTVATRTNDAELKLMSHKYLGTSYRIRVYHSPSVMYGALSSWMAYPVAARHTEFHVDVL